MEDYQKFIYKRTYARWLDDENRREELPETIKRYKDFFEQRIPEELEEDFEHAMTLVKYFEVMPSMRAFWTAGPALEREPIAGFNCAYTTIERPRDFSEILYILMNGTGVGFSTERQYINSLPEVPDELEKSGNVFKVGDSREGWAEGLEFLLGSLHEGEIPEFDYSQIRPKGARLKTFGGRASGPEPLKQLFDFVIGIFRRAKGRKLNSLECYDIVTMIASIVIAGGVRRSATINLSNLSDGRMKSAKEGQFWIDHPHRALSNNSVAYTEKPEPAIFLEEWLSLMRSGSGERGIINREALAKAAERVDREAGIAWGVNPCGEVILRPKQFCNLSEIVVRGYDTIQTLQQKAKAAAMLGCAQATLKNFGYVSQEWRDNAEKETVLGLSITGLKDHPVLHKNSEEQQVWSKIIRETARHHAKRFAEVMGLPPVTAVTTVKPSGTVSQLVGSSSGLHARFAPYYIRRVRVSASDPIAQFLEDEGVPCFPEVGESRDNCRTLVFEFPIDASDSYSFREEETAIEQLDYWLSIKRSWCDHNPSNTIFVKEDEWLDVGAWVYKHWDEIAGLSFLPYDGGVYQLAPYEEITYEEYEEMALSFPTINWDRLVEFEAEDRTEGSREFACIGDKCEI